MKKRLGLFAALGLAIIAAVLFFTFHPRERIHQGKALSQWALDLTSPEKTTREAAERVVTELGASAVPEWTRMLGTRDGFSTRPIVALASKVEGKLSPLLFRIFKPWEGQKTRLAAAMALELLGPIAAPAMPALGKALRDGDVAISWRAGNVLARIGKPAVPQFIAALEVNKPWQFSRVCGALASLGPDGVGAVRPLIELLLVLENGPANPSAMSSSAALTSIARSGPATAPPGSIVTDLVKALGGIGPAAIPSLTLLLQHPRPTMREHAAQALARMGPRGRAAIPALVGRLRDDSAPVRFAAVEALGQIRPWDPEIVAALTPMAEDLDDDVRSAAVGALASSLGLTRPASDPAKSRLAPVPARTSPTPDSGGWIQPTP